MMVVYLDLCHTSHHLYSKISLLLLDLRLTQSGKYLLLPFAERGDRRDITSLSSKHEN